jgi:hypothetical protein
MKRKPPGCEGALEGDPSKVIVESQTPQPAVPASCANRHCPATTSLLGQASDLDDHQRWLADRVLECYGPAAVGQFWGCAVTAASNSSGPAAGGGRRWS